jgi:hypothetical protein
MSNIVLMSKKHRKYLFTTTYHKRRVGARLVTHTHTHTCMPLWYKSNFIKKLLSKRGFEPSCVNYETIILMN